MEINMLPRVHARILFLNKPRFKVVCGGFPPGNPQLYFRKIMCDSKFALFPSRVIVLHFIYIL